MKAAEKAFAIDIAPFWHYWQDASQERIAEVYNQERAKSFAGGMERETVWEWLNRIGLETDK